MGIRTKKAKFICRHSNEITNTIKCDNITEQEKEKLVELLYPKFSIYKEQKSTEDTEHSQEKIEIKNIVDNHILKNETVKTIPIKEKYSENKYRFELLSYGYVTDIVTTDIKEKAIQFYCKFDSSSDFAFRLYINEKHIPYKEIKKTLGVTQKHIFKYYKSYK